MKTVDILRSKELIHTEHDEYYNLIRTNIQFSSPSIKVIMVTSVSKREGKSSIAFNMALSFVKIGKKVLLVDADVRNSAIYSRIRFGKDAVGLTNYLSGQASSEDVLYKTEYDNFVIIPSGPVPPNPSVLLQNKKFDRLISEMKEHCDYIFIDSPPVGLVADGLLLAAKSDGSVLVVENKRAKRKDVMKLVSSLQETGAEFLGVVLNKVEITDKTYGIYGTYGQYGKKRIN